MVIMKTEDKLLRANGESLKQPGGDGDGGVSRPQRLRPEHLHERGGDDRGGASHPQRPLQDPPQHAGGGGGDDASLLQQLCLNDGRVCLPEQRYADS